MDAKERLRRFLEQRREMGESELVLDGMSVEEVMRILGARGGAKPPLEREVRQGSAPAPGAPPAPRGDAPPTADPVSDADPGDWRAALRAAGAAAPGARPPAQATTPPAAPRADAPAPRPAPDDDDAAAAAAESQATIDAAADASARTRAEDAAIARRGEDGPNERGMEPSPAPGAATPEGAAPASNGAAQAGWEIPGIDVPTGIVVGAAAGELFGGPMSGLATLDDVVAAVASCTRCPLYATATRPVPGEGDPDADLMCVGEAPGQNEDETGRPFVGAAGQLLTKILAAIKLSRDEVFIANVLKHRPPGNRNPTPDEVVACSPYLVRQVELVRPKVIIAFGTFAAQTLLGTKTPIGKLRGAVHRYYGIPLVVTYHPAALLRNEAWKRPTWEDVKLARRILDRAAGA